MKTIPQAFLDTLGDLLVRNRYEIPDDGPPSVVDEVLERAYWTNLVAPTLRAPLVNQPELADRLDAWLRPYRVRRRTFGAGSAIQLGQTTDAGARIDLPDGVLLRNYFVVVAGPGVSVTAVQSTDLDFAPDADPEEHFPHGSLLERWVLTNTPEMVALSPAVFGEWQASPGRNVVLAMTPLASASPLDLGSFPVDVEVYVAFPRTGTILFPEWFLQGWTEVGDVFLVDRGVRVGGEFGGPSLEVGSGGGAGVFSLPAFARPFLDPGRIEALHVPEYAFRFDVPAQQADLPLVGTIVAQIDGLRWSPANDRGGLDLAFDTVDNRPALVATVDFDIADARITLLPGPEIRFERVRVAIALTAEVRDGRMFWDLDVDPDVVFAVGTPFGTIDVPADDILAEVEATLISAVEDAIDPVLVETVACLLFALPILREEPDIPAAQLQPAATFGAWMASVTDVTSLLVQLTDLLPSPPAPPFIRNPSYPTAGLPSSLLGAIEGGTLQRVLDRFVEYRSVTLEPDPDAPGRQRLVVDCELLDAHAGGGGTYTHEVVPREAYVLRPVEVRLLSHEKRWVDYAQLQLDDVLHALSGDPHLTRKYAPRLHLDFSVRAEHDALPGSPVIRELSLEQPLVEAEITSGDILHHHYEGPVLRPPLGTSTHLLELPSTLDTAGGEVVHEGRFAMSGNARLSFWSDGEAPQGCSRVLTQILARVAENFRRRQATPQTPDPIAESPAPPPASEASFTAVYDEVDLDLGAFTLDPALDMTDNTGLALVGAGADNVVTATGPGVEIDFLLERSSVPTDLLDWIQASFLAFRLTVDEKGTSPVNTTLDRIVDRAPFQLVAKLNGAEIASASFRLDGGLWNPATEVGASRLIPLRGEQWSRELYVPKDMQTFLTVRLEARRGSSVLAVAERTIPRFEPGVQWHEAADWGIPQGHDRVVLTLGSAQGGLEVECRLRNRAFDPGSIPIEHRPKEYIYHAEEVVVARDHDPFASGELKYWVELRRRVEGEDGFVEATPRTWTRVFEASSGDTIDPGIVLRAGRFKPGDTAAVGTGGREIDNPKFPFYDPHDWLEKGWEERGVVFDDSEDGQLEVTTPDYTIAGTWANTARPPAPELSVLDPDTGDFVSDALTLVDPAAPLRLRVRSSWLASLELLTFVRDGSELAELPVSTLGLPAPAPTGEYQPALTGDFSEDAPDGTRDHFTYYVDLPLSEDLPVELLLIAGNAVGETPGNRLRLRPPSV